MVAYLTVKDSLQPVGLVHLSHCLKLRKTTCTTPENEQMASMCHEPLATSRISI